MSSSDYKVELVDSSGEADMSVSVVGDQVVDLSGASEGQVLAVQADGTVAPSDGYGRELAYAEITSTFTNPSTAENDVTGLVINFTAPTVPVWVRFLGPINNGTGGQGHQIRIYRSDNGGAYAMVFDGAVMAGVNNAVTVWQPYEFRDDTLTPGDDYSYKVTIDTVNSGTLSILASALRPAFLVAWER